MYSQIPPNLLQHLTHKKKYEHKHINNITIYCVQANASLLGSLNDSLDPPNAFSERHWLAAAIQAKQLEAAENERRTNTKNWLK